MEKEAVSKVIREKLEGHFDIAADAATSLLSDLDALKPLARSRAASTVILCRMISDIRCIYMLAERGYSQQAATLMCTVREMAQQIVIIGGDDSLGERWFNHKDDEHSFPGVGREEVKRLFKVGLEAMGVPSDVGDGTHQCHESIYHKACMSKHANPRAQMIMTCNYEDGTAEPRPGPTAKSQSLDLARSSLFNTTQFTLLALWSFAFHQMRDDDKRRAVLARIWTTWNHLGTLQHG